MSLFFTIFAISAFLDKESSSQKYHNKEYKQIRSETWTKGTLQQCFADCDKTNVGHRIGIDDAITPQQQKKKRKPCDIQNYYNRQMYWLPGATNLYKLHKTANNVLVPWSIFPLRVLSPEKYVTISVRTQQSNGKAIGHGSFFLRRPKNS